MQVTLVCCGKREGTMFPQSRAETRCSLRAYWSKRKQALSVQVRECRSGWLELRSEGWIVVNPPSGACSPRTAFHREGKTLCIASHLVGKKQEYGKASWSRREGDGQGKEQEQAADCFAHDRIPSSGRRAAWSGHRCTRVTW